jgi:hypothetical protein
MAGSDRSAVVLDEELLHGLDTAFNEATLLGAEFDANCRLVALTIAGVSLDSDGNVPQDRRVQVILQSVGRLCACLRTVDEHHKPGDVIPFASDELLKTVQSFGGLHVYGWKFFDCGDDDFNEWKDRPSLKVGSETDPGKHTLDLFQDGLDRYLQLRIWFDNILFFAPDRSEIPVVEFVAAGKRGWDAIMLDGNKTVQDAFGIHPSR